MQVLYSKFSKKLHRYEEGRSLERCNVDQILDEDRVVLDVVDPTKFSEGEGLRLCKWCFPG